MDFKQAAQGVSQAPAPITPKVIISDKDRTLFFDAMKPNQVLVKFLALASQAGHHVFIVTKMGGYSGALENVDLSIRFAAHKMKEDLTAFRVAYKHDLNNILERENLGKPWLAFEDDIAQLQGPDAYAAPIFAEEVRGDSMDGNLEDLKVYAKLLGFADAFEAYLREQSASPAPAPAPAPRQG
jgi:hypothetical protein